MLANIDDQLQLAARWHAKNHPDMDKKQLRFNNIVSCAKVFYPQNPECGVRE